MVILRQIRRNNGLHPIRDRALIDKLMLNVKFSAKQIHHQCPWKWKYRNMEITRFDGVNFTLTGIYRTAGYKM